MTKALPTSTKTSTKGPPAALSTRPARPALPLPKRIPKKKITNQVQPILALSSLPPWERARMATQLIINQINESYAPVTNLDPNHPEYLLPLPYSRTSQLLENLGRSFREMNGVIRASGVSLAGIAEAADIENSRAVAKATNNLTIPPDDMYPDHVPWDEEASDHPDYTSEPRELLQRSGVYGELPPNPYLELTPDKLRQAEQARIYLYSSGAIPWESLDAPPKDVTPDQPLLARVWKWMHQ